MTINLNSNHVLKILRFVSYVLFIGICIETFGFIWNIIVTFSFEEATAVKFWREIDLSKLYKFHSTYFLILTTLMVIVSALRTVLFYLIITFLNSKNWSFSNPFKSNLNQFITNLAYLTFALGMFSLIAKNYAHWLINMGINLPSEELLRISGADIWFFMSITMFVITAIIKKGIAIQTENELTI